MNLPVPSGPPNGTGDPEQPAGADRADVDGTPERARPTRRQLDEIFGDVLPTVTRDELDDERDRAGGDRDSWYRDNRPPHHG